MIDNIQFEVNLTNLHSAIVASSVGLDNITITNNMINPYQSTPGSYVSGYGPRNAISINYDAYRVASGGVDNITVNNNMVSAVTAPDPALFRSGVSVDEGGGSYDGNTFQTISHDILIRFNSNGAVSITNNNFNGGGRCEKIHLREHSRAVRANASKC